MQTLIERLKENEVVAQKFHDVESRILTILNFKDFFEVLISEIEGKFSVPHVWITIADSCEITRFIDHLKKDRKSTRLNSSHLKLSRMPSSA